MLNQDRLSQLKDLMAERGWDLLLLYGHSWRKDFFRCLINVNFSGPHALAAVDRSGEVRAVMSDAWDAEVVAACPASANFPDGLRQLASRRGSVAIAGVEMMEARFVRPFSNPVSATLAVEEIRRQVGVPSAEAEPTSTDMSEDPRDLGEDLGLTEEMLVEEVSIDGMCGVY